MNEIEIKKQVILFVVVVLVAVGGFITGLLLLRQREKYELDCSRYATYSINELPVGCYDYFGIKYSDK